MSLFLNSIFPLGKQCSIIILSGIVFIPFFSFGNFVIIFGVNEGKLSLVFSNKLKNFNLFSFLSILIKSSGEKPII